jgi:hypothetical protein
MYGQNTKNIRGFGPLANYAERDCITANNQ